ncbi:MAG TPA: glucosylceramidase [Clostridiales bacterium UBA8960]|jgi:glucosylceramidase|nr:glucosylceramidase [Clostridiales bacterium UBA8960]
MKIIRTEKQTNSRLTEVMLKEGIEANIELKVNSQIDYQTHIGFGGAFTEAAATTFYNMSEASQNKIIKKYFDPVEGLGYTMGRVSIHSCDFSLENYTYVEEGDQTLETFDISREKKWVLPMISAAEKTAGTKLKILASPWSPPAYMKTNGNMNHGGSLLPDYESLWAAYYVKYIQKMKEEGIGIWGISVQNEPAAVQVWDSCIYSAEEERNFVKNHLGPTLEKANLQHVNVVIWDHNRDLIVERADTVLSDEDARKYVWGTGNHWYVSEAFENLEKLHKLHPDKHILFTEGCQEGGPHPDSWETGERYGRNIIGDFNHFSEGWLDWNLVLNEQGGPNHVGNYCDAPILCYEEKDYVHLNSSYYYIGHFSKYIRPGAKRIHLQLDTCDSVYATAFKNEDGSKVLVLMNEGEQVQGINFKVDEDRFVDSVPGRSITTYLI